MHVQGWGIAAWRNATIALALSLFCFADRGQAQTPESTQHLPNVTIGNQPPAATASIPTTQLLPTTPIAVPPRPDDPRAAKAYVALENHCARCHQAGKTVRPLASGQLSNILALNDVARNPVLVTPGLPDASRLYDVMVTRHAPLDVYEPGTERSEPQPEEIQAVREWITDLGPTVQACPSRKPVTNEVIEALVREAQRLERDGVKDLRFISLAHLHNGCASGEELSGYRQALTKLLNSLSWAPEHAALTALDTEGTLFALRLADLGWVAEHWEQLQRRYPDVLPNPVPEDVQVRAGTTRPVMNGDWLTATASQAPMYYDLLRLPTTLEALAKLNGVDISQNIRNASVRRAALRTSAITRGNRLAERHAGAVGGFWLIYDFATSSNEQDVFARPHGPKATPYSKTPFRPDQVRTIFTLPNGFQAFALFDAAGNRLDRVLAGIEKPFTGDQAATNEPGTTVGVQCFACHVDAIQGLKDRFRTYAIFEPSVMANGVRVTALPYFPSESEMSLLISGDNERYHNALRAAGIDPNLRIGGDEIVTALARRYQRASGFDSALAEIGLPRDAFLSWLSSASGPAAPLARRLQHGALPRADLERLFTFIKGLDEPNANAAPQSGSQSGGFLRDVQTEIGLSVWLDTARPAAGELVGIKAEADTDCYLTIISVDEDRKATVLFPNDFEPDNLLAAGKIVSIPNPTAPYQLRFKSGVAETLLARCSTSPEPPMGIEHDFERQRFTLLGNWEVFIRDTLATEAELRADPLKADRARAARFDAVRRRRAAGERIEQRTRTAPGRALRDGRAVLVISGR